MADDKLTFPAVFLMFSLPFLNKKFSALHELLLCLAVTLQIKD